MLHMKWFVAGALSLLAALPAQGKTMAEVLAASKPADWRTLDPAYTLYIEFDSGRVIIELTPDFAPQAVANLKTLVREKYFDGLFFIRAQDNYVVQWGDPDSKRPLGGVSKTLPAEFTRAAKGLAFVPLKNADAYAPEVGFVGGFPAARDQKADRAWLTHCYGMVGVGRDNESDSGNGSEVYVVIGHAPRHLDGNVSLVGRVVRGMELLSVLPRGTGALGFYERPSERTPLRFARLAADVPEDERHNLEVLRTDTPTFAELVESRRNRQEEWFKVQAGHIDICNVPIPVRERPR